MKRTWLMLGAAVLSFAFLSSSFAAVDSIKVSGDVTEQAITRDLDFGLDLGDERDVGNLQNVGDERKEFLLSQVRLRFDADLTEDVNAAISLINERLWGEDTQTSGAAAQQGDTDIDLDLAYIQLKEFLSQPLTLMVGRQPLRYGSGLVVGDPDTNQTASTKVFTQAADLTLRKGFDAIRAVFDYSPYTLDLVYAKIDEQALAVEDDVTLYGTNLAYMWDAYNGLTELYFFVSDNSRTNAAQYPEDQRVTHVAGLRTQLDPNDHLTAALEGAYQFGETFSDVNNDQVNDSYRHLKAWAYLASLDYKFLNDYNAKVGASYAYLSGNDVDHKNHGGWDPMYEDQTPGEIINLLAAASNCHVIGLNGSYMPQEDITLALQCYRAVVVEKFTSNTYTPPIGPASGYAYNINNENVVLGDEFDVCALYDYTEDVQLKLTSACFLPGNLLADENADVAYSIRGGLAVNF